jgi:hypothetical protein
MERPVLRRDEADFERPFLGLRIDDGKGSTGNTAMGLESSPHVIGIDPDPILTVLFGEEVEPGEGRIVHAPLGFERGQTIDYGPLIQLGLP